MPFINENISPLRSMPYAWCIHPHCLSLMSIFSFLSPLFSRQFSRASYVQSLLRPDIIKQFKLTERYGLKFLKRSPFSFTPLRDGSNYLLLGDSKLTHQEISKFSKKDAERYPEYENMLNSVVDVVEPLLDDPPIDPTHHLSSLSFQVNGVLSFLFITLFLYFSCALFYCMWLYFVSDDRVLNVKGGLVWKFEIVFLFLFLWLLFSLLLFFFCFCVIFE